MEKIKLAYPVVVEGRYDRIKLESLFDAYILTTEGFGIFHEKEKLMLIRRLAETYGALIILTDSDGAGTVIRNYFKAALPPERQIHLYTPQISGKEHRKAHPSKAGYLGVEGMEADTLRALLAPFAADTALPARGNLTKAMFYADGFSGQPDSAARREKLAEAASLPRGMSANALLNALNLLYGDAGYRALVKALASNEER